MRSSGWKRSTICCATSSTLPIERCSQTGHLVRVDQAFKRTPVRTQGAIRFGLSRGLFPGRRPSSRCEDETGSRHVASPPRPSRRMVGATHPSCASTPRGGNGEVEHLHRQTCVDEGLCAGRGCLRPIATGLFEFGWYDFAAFKHVAVGDANLVGGVQLLHSTAIERTPSRRRFESCPCETVVESWSS